MRYVQRLAEIDAANGPARVRVAVVGGVPLDYPEGGSLVFADVPSLCSPTLSEAFERIIDDVVQ